MFKPSTCYKVVEYHPEGGCTVNGKRCWVVSQSSKRDALRIIKGRKREFPDKRYGIVFSSSELT